jgi:thiamine biosynthesis lipoprotein ApbE
MGPEAGIRLAENLADAEVYIIDRYDKEYFSSGFRKYMLR